MDLTVKIKELLNSSSKFNSLQVNDIFEKIQIVNQYFGLPIIPEAPEVPKLSVCSSNQ